MLLIFFTSVFYVFSFSGSKHRNLINDFHFNAGFLSQIRSNTTQDFLPIHCFRITIQPDRIISDIFLNKSILLYSLNVPQIIGNNIRLAESREIRSYFIRGAVRTQGLNYPNREWGYGRLNLEETFNALLRV